MGSICQPVTLEVMVFFLDAAPGLVPITQIRASWQVLWMAHKQRRLRLALAVFRQSTL
jgi:hypothetical protein